MNCGKFKDPPCYLCYTGVVLTSLFPVQEVAGSKIFFYKNFAIEFGENHVGNTETNFIPGVQIEFGCLYRGFLSGKKAFCLFVHSLAILLVCSSLRTAPMQCVFLVKERELKLRTNFLCPVSI